MRIEVEIPEYNPEQGLVPIGVEPDTIIGAKQLDNIFYVSANKAGLISLAIHLLALAQDDTPIGREILYGEWNWLAEGSEIMIVRKIMGADHALPREAQNQSSIAQDRIRKHLLRGSSMSNHDAADADEQRK